MRKFYKRKPLILAVVLILSGMLNKGVAVCAAEQTVSYIYHQHMGSSAAEGGCYREPVYHKHTGDEETGGACYEMPIYHSHVGDEINGGNCYGTIRYHAHIGNSAVGGDCYQAVYHTHEETCYSKIAYDEDGCYIVDFWDTDEDDYEGHDYMWYQMSCGELLHGTSAWHQHKELNCGRPNGITGYVLRCSKTESSVEGYAISCEKTAETVDGYGLSCSKTLDTVEGYQRSCGKEEDIPYGKIIVSKQLTEGNEVVISVNVEDMTDGELQFSDTPFVWYDEQGEMIGTDSGICVSQNGVYKVKVDIVNEEINKEGLWSTITIDDIKPPTASKDDETHEEKDSETEAGNAEEVPLVTPESNATPARPATPVPIAAPTPTETPTPTASPTPTVTPVPTPTPTPVIKRITGKSQADLSGKSKEIVIGNESEMLQSELAEGAATPNPTPTPELKKEIQTVKIEEKKSSVEMVADPEEIKREGFLQSPVGKLIVITFGTLLVFTGIFLLFYLLRQSVNIYNDDGQGNLIYLGRTMVQLTDAGYLVIISEQMAERAYTNRFCVKPGLFRFGRGEEEELLIEKQDKRISAPLQKEMMVVI